MKLAMHATRQVGPTLILDVDTRCSDTRRLRSIPYSSRYSVILLIHEAQHDINDLRVFITIQFYQAFDTIFELPNGFGEVRSLGAVDNFLDSPCAARVM
jgi:hypothetical protein